MLAERWCASQRAFALEFVSVKPQQPLRQTFRMCLARRNEEVGAWSSRGSRLQFLFHWFFQTSLIFFAHTRSDFKSSSQTMYWIYLELNQPGSVPTAPDGISARRALKGQAKWGRVFTMAALIVSAGRDDAPKPHRVSRGLLMACCFFLNRPKNTASCSPPIMSVTQSLSSHILSTEKST